MAEFSGASLWMKLTMMLVSGAFSMHLFAMDQPYGWSQYQVVNCNSGGGCTNVNAVRAVQALEVIGFLSVLTALFLSLCLVLLDELKGNKIALICLCLFSLLAGLMIIIGIAVYEGTTNTNTSSSNGDGSEYASTVGVMSGICALLGGVFCILELVGVKA